MYIYLFYILMRILFLLIFSFGALASWAGNTDIDKTKQAGEWLKNKPLAFIENKGQFTDTDGKPADNVLFKASYGNCDIYITTKGLSYVFVKYEEKQQKSRDTLDYRMRAGEIKPEEKSVSYYRMDMNLQGSAINKTQIIKEQPGKQGVTNYFYPHCPDGIYGVQEYGKITIKNIYRGIDWVIYTNADNKESPLKYDFVVQPQADYRDIKMKFVNAQSTHLLDNGTKLKTQTIAGTIEEGNLYSYQENGHQKQAIKTIYTKSVDNTLQFELGAYDKTKTLVIDPLVWATYYGQISYLDYFESICADHKDNFYITGRSSSPIYPTQFLPGAYWQQTNAADYDAVIIKFNKLGVRQWATYYGGSGYEGGGDYGSNSICVDNNDNIFIAGTTTSSNLPLQQSPGAYFQLNDNSSVKIFILKFNNQGVRQWATYYGGNFWEVANSIKADSNDNIYITGTTRSVDFPTQEQPGAYWQPKIGDNWGDIFILKFSNKGECLWSTYYGGNENDGMPSICIDNHDNIYITGLTTSPDFPSLQLNCPFYQPSIKGWMDAFLLKFDDQGVRQWATYFGGNGDDTPMSICSDHQDNIYVTGFTTSSDFPTQSLSGAYNQKTHGGGYETIFLLRLNYQGVIDWATYYGGYSKGMSVCSDNQNNIYIAGYTFTTNFPTQLLVGEYWQPTIAGIFDAVILKFNKKGACLWATYYGGDGVDKLKATVSDSQNSIYFIADYLSDGAYLVDYGNGAHFDNHSYSNGILKFDPCYNQKPTSIQSDRNNLCINETGNIVLTAIGGTGDTLKWYSDKAGLNYLGKGTPFSIPVPAQTTTYYARWESLCDTSMCDSVTVTIYTQITKNISPVICQGETYTVGSSVYSAPGLYEDVLKTVSGCDSIVTTNLSVNPLKQIIKMPEICQGEVYKVGTNNYTTTGNYTDILKTYLGCDSTVITHLSVNPVKQITQSQVICKGEIYKIGIHEYTSPGIYIDTLLTSLHCDSIITTHLTVNPVPQTIQTPVICQGEVFKVGNNIYAKSGVYIDKLSSVHNCDSIVTTQLTVGVHQQNTLFHSICQGESFSIGTHNYTASGIYTDTLATMYNCDSIVTTNLTVNPKKQFESYPSICEGESIKVGTNTYSQTGVYTNVFKTSHNCDSTVITHLIVNPLPYVSLGSDMLLCPGDSVILTPGDGFSSYLWSDGSVLSKLKVTAPGTYAVTVYNAWCPAGDEITIRECGSELWFPNAFSPNHDNNNDTFRPVVLGTLNAFHLIIYNRWGQQVYESHQANPGWDGTFQGILCAVGQYVYTATFSVGTEPSTQKQRIQRGSVTLLK